MHLHHALIDKPVEVDVDWGYGLNLPVLRANLITALTADT